MSVFLTRLLSLGLPFFVANALLPLSAEAATTRVDDSGTVVSQGLVQMRWKQLVPGRGADHSVEANVRVALRLNLAQWLNKPVRLYMALAPAMGDPIYARWQTQGRLLPGSLRSGNRTLVFDSTATTPLLEETLELALTTDGRALTSTQALQFYFEVDTP
jgi:hypothetical protein